MLVRNADTTRNMVGRIIDMVLSCSISFITNQLESWSLRAIAPTLP